MKLLLLTVKKEPLYIAIVPVCDALLYSKLQLLTVKLPLQFMAALIKLYPYPLLNVIFVIVKFVPADIANIQLIFVPFIRVPS
jgi:hypothetical protein